MSERHTTWYEDDGFVGVSCDGKQVNSLAAGEPPEQCDRCGAWLIVEWKVRVVEVAHPTPAPTPDGPE